MAKKLDNNNGLLQKFWNTKAVIPLAAMALIFPISNLNATEITNRRNTIAQTNEAQTEQPGQSEQPAQTQPTQQQPGQIEQPAQTQPTQQQPREQVTSDELDNPEEYIGRTVTVRGNFIETIGENGFTITPERLFTADPILVINVSGAPLDLPSEDIHVQATGEVQRFTLSELAEEYDMEFDRETYALYENEPVIIARSIAPAPEPNQVNDNPDPYYNKNIAVEGEIGAVYSSQAFTLDDDLLVLNLNPEFDRRQQAQVEDTYGQTEAQVTDANGQRVVVTGVLRTLVIEDLERDYDLTTLDAEVQRQLEVDYADRPVLISDGIYPFPTQE